MPVIDHLDLATKHIYLAVGVRTYHPVTDIYHEVRELRRLNESLRTFSVPVTAAGNVPKGGGKFTPRYALFRNGWTVVPEDTSHTLVITGEQLTDSGGAGPDCMDLTPLSATSKVIVQYEPPAAEVILVSTGGVAVTDVQAGLTAQGYTAAKAALLDAAISSRATEAGIWSHAAAARLLEGMTLLGMDPAVVVEHGETYIRAPPDGSIINIQLTKVGNKVTKQRV